MLLKLEIFVRGTCERINFSGNGFIKAVYSFPNIEFFHKPF